MKRRTKYVFTTEIVDGIQVHQLIRAGHGPALVTSLKKSLEDELSRSVGN